MKFLKYVLFFLLILVIGFTVYISVQPNHFYIYRTRQIPVNPAVLYNHVIDFKNWDAWSAWKEKDTTTTFSYSEKTTGTGASLSWTDSNGKGRMDITSTTPNSLIEYQMQFEAFEPSKVTLNFEAVTATSTKITWAIDSKKLPFIFKAMAVLSGGFDCMIGPDIERSLEKLDRIVVNSTKAYSVKVNGLTEYGGGFYLYKTSATTGANISDVMAQQYGDIISYMTAHKIMPNGSPFTIYLENDLDNGNIIMSNAIAVKEKIPIEEKSTILCGYLEKTKVIKTTLTGNYTNLGKAWQESYAFITKNGFELNPYIKPFEVYANDPEQTPNPSNWITEIYIPIQ